MSPSIASVVIPACNEENTISRCLQTLLDGAHYGELEVIVVCNGCRDSTAEKALTFAERGVRVIDTAKPSKSNALNLGDAHAKHFPRLYLDADIQLHVETVRSMASLLKSDAKVLLTAPHAIVDYSASAALVRAYYRVWTQLPYFTENMIGSGVYAFSEAGRARFGKFPSIIADDEYARRMVTPEERKTSAGSFVISAPRTLKSLLAVNTRVRAGIHELAAKFPALSSNRGTNPRRSLHVIASKPLLWSDAPVYIGVMLAAEILARRNRRNRSDQVWNQDYTARGSNQVASGPPIR